MKDFIFGTLSLEAFDHEISQTIAVVSMVIGMFFVLGLITYFKRWRWIYKDWFCSLDPKRIGVMYLIIALVMFLKGFGDAVMMRTQQVMGVGDSMGFISAHHFQEVFSAHGTVMIFFVGMGVIFGLMNLIVPLQIGARDVAFPFLNAISFWLFAAGGMLMLISLAIGGFSISGWLSYPPLSGLEYSPSEGTDYWIWMVQVAGVGSTLAAINFLVTILKMRCPGMHFMRLPIFVWSCLGSVILVIFAFPILTATLALLTLDRYLGMHFFTPDFGGNPMLYVNLIWAWGHPEVYILILPAFGVFSEIVATFSRKRLFGYTSMVWAILAIVVLSFVVWLHHFFTMGAGPHVNAFFGIMTMLIAIPTGVKVFNWLFTKFRGEVHLDVPMLWFFAFVLNFSVAGMTGILLSSPPVDFELHNSLFLVAHFHGMVIGSFLFGFFAAFNYWWPKVTGYQLNQRWGVYAFWCWFMGFLLAFMPLYVLGFMGATRRLNNYPAETGWHPYFMLVAVGVAIIFCGINFQVIQLIRSYMQRRTRRAIAGDPWDGRTLEWSTTSPPPEYNFAKIPQVHERDIFWAMKYKGVSVSDGDYEDIYLPISTGVPFLIGMLVILFGFGFTWKIWWMVISSFVGVVALLITHLSKDDAHEILKADEVRKMEEASS